MTSEWGSPGPLYTRFERNAIGESAHWRQPLNFLRNCLPAEMPTAMLTTDGGQTRITEQASNETVAG